MSSQSDSSHIILTESGGFEIPTGPLGCHRSKSKKKRRTEELTGWNKSPGKTPLTGQTERSHFEPSRRERPVGFANKKRETHRSAFFVDHFATLK
ncbi:hypothetical protein L596_030301 [Steinernema carpocapsae]|uniref:Uncharacterized protein n=1 Tax=Steinernema carpocapsae TaxID=34508 RepID=A0A4U5LNZ0_STECR|nr:hypothetical protein L596_030301 [Steinernema carpocapsae]